MNRTLTLAALLLVFTILPIAGIAYVGHASKPKQHKLTREEVYSDEHLFV